jgi:hypothetical protein
LYVLYWYSVNDLLDDVVTVLILDCLQDVFFEFLHHGGLLVDKDML